VLVCPFLHGKKRNDWKRKRESGRKEERRRRKRHRPLRATQLIPYLLPRTLGGFRGEEKDAKKEKREGGKRSSSSSTLTLLDFGRSIPETGGKGEKLMGG